MAGLAIGSAVYAVEMRTDEEILAEEACSLCRTPGQEIDNALILRPLLMTCRCTTTHIYCSNCLESLHNRCPLCQEAIQQISWREALKNTAALLRPCIKQTFDKLMLGGYLFTLDSIYTHSSLLYETARFSSTLCMSDEEKNVLLQTVLILAFFNYYNYRFNDQVPVLIEALKEIVEENTHEVQERMQAIRRFVHNVRQRLMMTPD